MNENHNKSFVNKYIYVIVDNKLLGCKQLFTYHKKSVRQCIMI